MFWVYSPVKERISKKWKCTHLKHSKKGRDSPYVGLIN